MASRAEQLRSLGQSVWLDFIRRGFIESGEFDALVRDQGVVGVTSNPTIFQQALSEGTEYDGSLRRFLSRGLAGPALFEAIAVEDIQMACDRLRPVFEQTGGIDGRVSIEVGPHLASDTQGTLDEARRLHREVARPNVMVKIPATKAGLPAIASALADGICINVTLVFSLARYEEVMDAYLQGIERRLAQGLPVNDLHSVASFFVSRVDTKVDHVIDEQLAKLPAADPRRSELEAAKGKAAIANARLAYARFREIFASPRFEASKRRGARVQRPLWASTSTKNPAYPDTLYVDELVGADTVNTMPQKTLEAFNQHGAVEVRIDRDVDRAHALFQRLPELGVPIDALIEQLEPEGVATFAKSYDGLIEALEKRRRELHGGRTTELRFALGAAEPAVRARLRRFDGESFPRRLWARDTSLWGADPAHQEVARHRLGWLDAIPAMEREAGNLKTFGRAFSIEGYTRAVLLGMGGSSLAPEVFSRTFGPGTGGLPLTVLDSTSPESVRAVTMSHDPRTTLFIVSSKSGATIEVATLEKHFFAWVRAALSETAGRSFIAITDPETPLAALAQTRGYRRTFLNPPDIGGRYSALSCFGLVPAAIVGIDLTPVLEHALDETRVSGPDVTAAQSPDLRLGAALGELALAGRDKVTLVLTPEWESLASWVEQLLAESLGKLGKGVVPVAGEPLGPPEEYGDDRVFVSFGAVAPSREIESRLDALERAGHPVLRWRAPEPSALGAEFFRWEIATVAAGAVLEVDPFDEPNVTEAKTATRAVLDRMLEGGAPPPPQNLARAGSIVVEAPRAVVDAIEPHVNGRRDAAAWVAALLGLVRPRDYVALLAFFHHTPERDARLERLRLAIRHATRAATTLGYGPRYLHSTGQLHKGGPNHGVFLQLLADPGDDVPIPDERFGFGALYRAQAEGDYQVLARHGRRVLRLDLGTRPEPALDEIVEAIAAVRVQ
jgi:transaldolase/glucose-6-phosphate isomerase